MVNFIGSFLRVSGFAFQTEIWDPIWCKIFAWLFVAGWRYDDVLLFCLPVLFLLLFFVYLSVCILRKEEWNTEDEPEIYFWINMLHSVLWVKLTYICVDYLWCTNRFWQIGLGFDWKSIWRTQCLGLNLRFKIVDCDYLLWFMICYAVLKKREINLRFSCESICCARYLGI